jgi:molybdopterin molybdotransferase
VAVVLLPGEPVACVAAYELLVGPAIRRLAGLPEALPHPRRRLRLTAKIASQVGTTELWLVRPQDNGVAPLAPPDRATLGTVVKACGFVLVGPESEGHDAGSEVELYFLGSDYG